MRWCFEKLLSGRDRQSNQGEFFSTEGVGGLAKALVRESIQNSLDARDNDNEKVIVRISLSGAERAVKPEIAERYFEGAWEHFSAPESGLRELPERYASCPYIAFEDFGTTGLRGDPALRVSKFSEDKDAGNEFYHFFRAEGRSAKAETARGRWGVGKAVFYSASRVSAFFGCTVRDNGGTCEALLMGQAVLRSHNVANTRFAPDGWAGRPEPDDFVLPEQQPSIIQRFVSDFDLSRGQRKGLSVVIPYPVDDGEDGICAESFLSAAASEYLVPLLQADVEIEIASGGHSPILLTDESLAREVRKLPAGRKKDDNAGDLLSLVELGEWAVELRSNNPGKLLVIDASDVRPPDWRKLSIPAQTLTLLGQQLKAGQKTGVRVRLQTQKKGQEIRETYFDVFMERDVSGTATRPVFFRQGIRIPDVRPKGARGWRALVIVDDKPLSQMLGDAENPAHTQWQQNGRNFRKAYFYGKQTIDFVVHSVSGMLQQAFRGEKEQDPTLLADFFSLPTSESGLIGKDKPKTTDKPGPQTPEPPPLPPPLPRPYRLQKRAGGFVLGKGDSIPRLPLALKIVAAYDTRRSNAIGHYRKEDFRFEDMHFDATGVIIRSRHLNELHVTVTDPDFSLSVEGFDTRRDLVVRASEERGEEDAQ